jgi:hypothetical protein
MVVEITCYLMFVVPSEYLKKAQEVYVMPKTCSITDN